ncbi:MAG TPA: hypothetical protein VJ689_12325 [Gaiellaceae bacterium]|nr:hypothetical protein [Gaiellaceae bacterium]
MSNSTASADSGASRQLFAYEVRREGRPLVVLRGMQQGNGPAPVVEAEVTRAGDAEAVVRPFPFATEQQARRFVDEALLTLEYLDCNVVDPSERGSAEKPAAG